MAEPISDMANMRHDLTYQEKPRSVLTAATSTIVFVPAGNDVRQIFDTSNKNLFAYPDIRHLFRLAAAREIDTCRTVVLYIHVLVPGTGTVAYCTVPVHGESTDCTVTVAERKLKTVTLAPTHEASIMHVL